MNRDLQVGVPDAARGRSLVVRIAHSELSGSDTAGWTVIGSINGNLPETLTAIREWLHNEGIEHTAVRIGDHAHTMTRE